MKTYAKYSIDVCADCAYMAANGWDESLTGRELPTPEPLCLVPASALVGTGDDDPFFSWSRCEGCGSNLGGDRYTLSVVETAPEGVRL